jgi:hypothetical protein
VTFQAGIIVRDGRNFRFFAASDIFEPLEGQRFDNPKTAQQAALRRLANLASRRLAAATEANTASGKDNSEEGADALHRLPRGAGSPLLHAIRVRSPESAGPKGDNNVADSQ